MIERNVDLSRANSLALSARAERLAVPTSVEQLTAVLRRRRSAEPLYILGGGSNILLRDDLPGLTVMPRLPGIEQLGEDRETVRIRAGAGVVWDHLVAETVRWGCQGLENLSLIPGTAGAAPFQNIGAYGVELADVLESVETVAVDDGQPVRFNADQCRFDYRDSLFKSSRRNEFIITHITLRLSRSGPCRIGYGALANWFAAGDAAPVTAAMVRRAVISLRQSKLPEPQKLANAGSFFKNPMVGRRQYEKLLRQHPDVVAFDRGEAVKLAAGWLIERAGWKGRRLGPVGMHERQALVLVNYGGASAQQVLDLAAAVRADVQAQFGVTLEQEPVILP